MLKTENTLLTGPVGPALLRFALPFFAASFLQLLYGAVDMAAVGQFSTSAALAGVSSGSQVMHTVTALVVGLSTGGTVLIGQYVGARREEEISRAIGTMFPLFALVAVVISVVMAAGTPWIVLAMQVPAAAVEQAEHYLFICALGMVFVTGYNMVAGILRGLGDSKSPLILIAIACVLNIVGDLILVGPLQMGAMGAAVATVAAQGISFVLSVAVLRRRENFPFDFHRRSFSLKREYAALLLKLGVPVSMQEFLIGFSFLLITAFVNRMGLDQSASVGVVEKVISFAMVIPIAFLSAIAAMTAQNMGAGQPERARAALRWGIVCSLLFGCLTCGVIQLCPDLIMSVFSDDAGVVYQGALYMRSYGLDCILVAFVFCLNGFFSGCGHTGFSMANSLIATFGVRAPGVLIISLFPGATMFHIGLAAPVASVVQVAIQLLYLRSGRWRKGIFAVQKETAP